MQWWEMNTVHNHVIHSAVAVLVVVVVVVVSPQKIKLIEVSCPADINVVDKEGEKVSKYQRLSGEMSRTYLEEVVTVPVVFGVSGIVSKHQKSHLEKLQAYNDILFSNLQKAAMHPRNS